MGKRPIAQKYCEGKVTQYCNCTCCMGASCKATYKGKVGSGCGSTCTASSCATSYLLDCPSTGSSGTNIATCSSSAMTTYRGTVGTCYPETSGSNSYIITCPAGGGFKLVFYQGSSCAGNTISTTSGTAGLCLPLLDFGGSATIECSGVARLLPSMSLLLLAVIAALWFAH